MNLTTSLARAALLTGLLLCAGMAAADERADTIERLVQAGPLRCSDEAVSQFHKANIALLSVRLVENVRQPWKLSDKWARGNADYDQAVALMTAALNDSEQRAGPLFKPATGSDAARTTFESMNTDELAAAKAFLTRPEGLVYWTYFVELGGCKGLAQAIEAVPGGFKPDAALLARIGALEKNMEKDFSALSKAQQNEVIASSKQINPKLFAAFKNVGNTPQGPMQERIGEIVRANLPALRKLAKTYALP